MKLVSFNIWGGTIYEPLMDYLKKLSADTDIFCFQEVFSSLPGAPEASSGARMFLFEELSAILPDFNGFFDLRSAGYDFDGPIMAPVSHGLAVFVRASLGVKSCNSKLIEVTGEKTDRLVKVQILELSWQGRSFWVVNFHGRSKPGDKLDTAERLAASEQLAQILQSLNSPKILCGDFNLMPETESVKILETGMKNLIKEFRITNTRNKISWDKYQNLQHFADFTFVSPEIKVKSFEVPYNEVSDHLPMILEFEV